MPLAERPEVQLRRVQEGLDPLNWKPMTSVGPGVREIRVRDSAGAFRVIYVASFPEAVYVLHAFQKKSERTPKEDLVLAKSRYPRIEARPMTMKIERFDDVWDAIEDTPEK